MLSDEEKQAIEGLKGSQKWMRQQIRLGNLPNYNQGYYADIQIVLNLIEKQSKEIEDYIENKELINQTLGLEKDLDINKTLEKIIILNNYEDKIKAKIEEQDKIIKKGGIDFNTKSYARCKKVVLQSLLEKED